MVRTYLTLLIVLCVVAGCRATPIRPVSGEATFSVHCAACHGRRATGDGPVAATLTVPPPNLTTLSQRNGGEFPAERVASYIDGRDLPRAHGSREMPVWGGVFDVTGNLIETAGDAEQRIAELIDYLRTLQVSAN